MFRKAFVREIVGLVLASSLIGTPAKASIVLGSQQTILNFDFSGENPPPPYTNIMWQATFDLSDPISGSDDIWTFIYGDLNGGNLLQIRDDTLCSFCFSAGGTVYGPLTTANALFDPMLDGRFSIGFQMIAGTAVLNSLSATSLIWPNYGSTITVTSSSTSIPEPTSIFLFATALAMSTARLLQRRPGKSARRTNGFAADALSD